MDGAREMAERFLREARAVAAINHPNVITVHGVGEHEGRSYMALEYVPGGDVQDLLDRSGSIDEVRALELVRDCATENENKPNVILLRKCTLKHTEQPLACLEF